MEQNVNQYIQQLLPQNHQLTEQLIDEAIKAEIPIMEETALHLLMTIINIQQPKKILEIGTGIGYSAIRMADACPYSKIVTLENDHKRYNQAVKIIEKYKKSKQIKVINEDALQYLTTTQGDMYDFIFIDAAKSKYKQFFKQAERHLNDEGIIVTDNVLFRHYVVNSKNIPHRYKKIVKNIQAYNDWLAKHPNFMTTFIPIGDGIAISIKIAK